MKADSVECSVGQMVAWDHEQIEMEGMIVSIKGIEEGYVSVLPLRIGGKATKPDPDDEGRESEWIEIDPGELTAKE